VRCGEMCGMSCDMTLDDDEADIEGQNKEMIWGNFRRAVNFLRRKTARA
jgi:hypothetical protein